MTASPGPQAPAELLAYTNFSFLHGASHAAEMVRTAQRLGLRALGVCDTHSFAGLVRAHVAAKEAGLKFVPGARLVLADCPLVLACLPRTRAGYGALSRLLTAGKRRADKGACHLYLKDVLEGGLEECEIIVCPPDPLQTVPQDPIPPLLQRVQQRFGEAASLAFTYAFDGCDQQRLAHIKALSAASDLPLIASNQPIMHIRARRPLADVLSCLRLGCTIDTLGRSALKNAEACLKDLRPLFDGQPAALARADQVAARCTFSLDQLRYEYPDEISPDGQAPQQRLADLAQAGLARRYPAGPPPKVVDLMNHELALIEKLDYAPYFLTVEDIVRYARRRDILCQGRGSAANSVVCFLLGITEVPPELISMVFERFVSEARDEPPDIDVDFEHERREEVIQYIYERFGRHRAGLCATVTHFRSRMAIREVGKVMGLSNDILAQLNAHSWGSWSTDPPDPDLLRTLGLDPEAPRLRHTLELVRQLIGFPRHLGQHVGGFIMTRGRLDSLCPIENAAMEDRTIIEWDKDDIDALGILKVDVLSLGMLTCLRKGFDLIRTHERRDLTLATLPREDPSVYDMLCQADSIGVFQVESRAQMAFLPRMRPRTFYDLVIEVAIVRPGPIQGGMVHPYIKRRNGEETIAYPSEELRRVLKKTLGVPLFQEQAMQIAIVAAGFSPSEADGLRRAMATFRKSGTIGNYGERFVQGMIARGYDADFANRCFAQIEGFGEYGFPESHAASFAYLVYASAWMKRHYPAIFTCALLNAQPMGFYAPAQLVRDARNHGVEVRPVCINQSSFDNSLERNDAGHLALRLGFRQIKGVSAEDGEWIAAARGNGYHSAQEVWQRAGVSHATLTKLAEADAFQALGHSRRDTLWAIAPLKPQTALPLFADGETIQEAAIAFPAMTEGEHVLEDYMSLRLTLRTHPVALLRDTVAGDLTSFDNQEQQGASSPPQRQLHPASDLQHLASGHRLCVCGLVLARQKPGTASGVVFLTLEDETGSANIVVWPKVYAAHKRIIINARFLKIEGKLERQGIVAHLIADRLTDLSPLLADLPAYDLEDDQGAAHRPEPESERRNQHRTKTSRPIRLSALPSPLKNKAAKPIPRARHPREQAKVLFPSRDFH